MPTPIYLDSSGLHCSSGTEVLNRHGKLYSNMATLMNQDAHLCSASPQTTHLRPASSLSFKSALVLFSTICSFGYGLSCMAHSLQEKVTVTSKSTFSNAINSYHRVNTLYDGTINCFSTLAQSSIASNKTFLYNQALKQIVIMKAEVIGLWLSVATCHTTRKQSWAFGASSASNIRMGLLIIIIIITQRITPIIN